MKKTNTCGNLIRLGSSLPNLLTGHFSMELSLLNLGKDFGKHGAQLNVKFSFGWPSGIGAGLQID
jgi:hypothetical protein